MGWKVYSKDKDNNDNRKKTRKMGKILHDRIVGMFKGDESREVNHNVFLFNLTRDVSPLSIQGIQQMG